MDYSSLSVEQDYFHWLCEMVNIEQEGKCYWNLAWTLHKIAFYPLIEHDENRAYDGVELREVYLREVNYPECIEIDGDCSVFEMLIALSRRMEFETTDPYNGDIENYTDSDLNDRTSYWFWEILKNLGLDKYSDEDYYYFGGQHEVYEIVDYMLSRSYSWNGEGGMFPLNNPTCDQRGVEIWYQMCAYLYDHELT